jgi:hypothetical protein
VGRGCRRVRSRPREVPAVLNPSSRRTKGTKITKLGFVQSVLRALRVLRSS